MWSDDSRFTQFLGDGHIRVRGEAEVRCLLGQIWAGVAAVAQVQVQQHYVPKEWVQMTFWIYWMTRLFHQRIFLIWWHGLLTARWQSQDSGSDCERVVQGAREIIFTHGQSPDPNPIENLWDVLEKPLCSGSTHIKATRSNVTLDGNKLQLQLQMLQTMPQGMCAAIKA